MTRTPATRVALIIVAGLATGALTQNGQTVTMPVLLAAVRAEMRKLEKPVSEADFRTFEVFT